jgi:hypothetical protein
LQTTELKNDLTDVCDEDIDLHFRRQNHGHEKGKSLVKLLPENEALRFYSYTYFWDKVVPGAKHCLFGIDSTSSGELGVSKDKEQSFYFNKPILCSFLE